MTRGASKRLAPHSHETHPRGEMQADGGMMTRELMGRMEDRLGQQGRILYSVRTHWLPAIQRTGSCHAAEQAAAVRSLQESLQTLTAAAASAAQGDSVPVGITQGDLDARLWPFEALLEQAFGEH